MLYALSAFADDDKKEILQDLICELSGTSLSIRDGVASQKVLPNETTNVRVSRSIESWNKSKKDMDITITPRSSSSKLKYEYLAILGRFNGEKTQKNVWYENTDDVYEITEIDEGKKAPSHIENIRIDRVSGDLYYRKATVGMYSAVKVLSGKCVLKEKAKVLN